MFDYFLGLALNRLRLFCHSFTLSISIVCISFTVTKHFHQCLTVLDWKVSTSVSVPQKTSSPLWDHWLPITAATHTYTHNVHTNNAETQKLKKSSKSLKNLLINVFLKTFFFIFNRDVKKLVLC